MPANTPTPTPADSNTAPATTDAPTSGDTPEQLSGHSSPPAPVDPTPDTPAAEHRGFAGRVVGANEILARGAAPHAATHAATHAAPHAAPTGDLKRTGRVMSVPPDIVDRVAKSNLNRTDLLLIAVYRYGDQLQHIPRRKTRGRVRFVVSLNDEEHARLLRIAKRRGWPLSPTAAALLHLYFTDNEQNTQ